tara:strand:- start:665 stop:1396 length:732 start_codon:yes stop_codon:yes gene_type:complete
MAGDPGLSTSREILLSLQEAGADIIELGIPYSDPLADGPVLQEAASRALSVGTTPKKVLEMVKSLREELLTPLVLFTYSNPLINYGIEKFCADAFESGAAGLVVPDLPLEEAEVLSSIAEAQGLDLILLIAPTSPMKRIKKISTKSMGFTYLVSVTGVTGERSKMDDRVQSLVKKVKDISSTPLAVGFGISGPEQIKQVRNFGADGAIVGSALVKKIAMAQPGQESSEASLFCKELSKATFDL